jgi:glycosyltransferase involved in cell wall biosynthesis
MRLAYLDPHAVPDDSPEALQILYTADALGEIGVDVTLVTPRPRRALAAESILGRPLCSRVELHYLPDPRKRWWFPLASNKPFYFMAARALRDHEADVVLVRNLKMAEYLLQHVPQVPLLFETHEVFAQTYREEHPNPTAREQRKLDALIEREGFVYRHSAGLIALTPLLLEDIRRVYSVSIHAIVAPDGVDLEQAQHVPAATPNPVPVLLYLGSLHPWKGVDVLVRAMVHVKNKAVLHIAGGNARRIEELRGLAHQLGVEHRVVFLGPIPPGRRFELIARADICLLPLTQTSIASRYTSPLKLFEYMAAGRAIVASRLPSLASVLENGQTSLLVDPNDPRGFATAIDSLLNDAELRIRLGAHAAESAVRFSWVSRSSAILGLIADCRAANRH